MSWARTAIFSIIVMAIMWNAAKGITNAAFPQFVEEGYTEGLTYNQGYENNFVGDMNATLTPEADAISATNGLGFIGFMNKLNLGFMISMYTSIKGYMFGLSDDLATVVGHYMAKNPALNLMLFGTLRTIVLLAYIFGAWMLITGRDILGD